MNLIFLAMMFCLCSCSESIRKIMSSYAESIDDESANHMWYRIQAQKMDTMVFIALFHDKQRCSYFKDMVLLKPHVLKQKYQQNTEKFQMLLNVNIPIVQEQPDSRACVDGLLNLWTISDVDVKVLKCTLMLT